MATEVNLNYWQDEFVFSEIENTALFNEFGSGKTTAGIIKLQKILDENQGCVGVVLRNTIDELKTATIPQFFEFVFGDRRLVPENVYYNMQDKHVVFPNKSEIWFMALDQEKQMRKLKNMIIGVLWADQGEEILQEIWTMACNRVRQKNMPCIKFMTGNAEGGDHWVRDYYYKDELDVSRGKIDNEDCEWGTWTGLDESYLGIMAKPRHNEPNLEKDYYKRLIRDNSRSWVLKYVYSQWIGKGGRVYNISEKNIVRSENYLDLESLTEFDIFFGMQDYGISDTNPMVFLLGLRDLTGKVYIIYEYYEYGKGIKGINVFMKDILKALPFKWRFIVGCPRTFQKEANKDGTTRKPADLFDFSIIPFPIHFDVRQQKIEKLIEDGELLIYERCTNLLKEIKNFKWKNIKNAENHAIEAMERGVCKALVSKRSSQRKETKESKKSRPLTAGFMKREF